MAAVDARRADMVRVLVEAGAQCTLPYTVMKLARSTKPRGCSTRTLMRTPCLYALPGNAEVDAHAADAADAGVHIYYICAATLLSAGLCVVLVLDRWSM